MLNNVLISDPPNSGLIEYERIELVISGSRQGNPTRRIAQNFSCIDKVRYSHPSPLFHVILTFTTNLKKGPHVGLFSLSNIHSLNSMTAWWVQKPCKEAFPKQEKA